MDEEGLRIKHQRNDDYFTPKMIKYDKLVKDFCLDLMKKYNLSVTEAVNAITSYQDKHYSKEGNNLWLRAQRYRILSALNRREICHYCNGIIIDTNISCHHKEYNIDHLISQTYPTHKLCHYNIHHYIKIKAKQIPDMNTASKYSNDSLNEFFKRKVIIYDYKAKQYLKAITGPELTFYWGWVGMKNPDNLEGRQILKKGVNWFYLYKLNRNEINCCFCRKIVYFNDARIHHELYYPDVFVRIFSTAELIHSCCHQEKHKK